jgi:alpha-galactosidase
LPDPAVLSRAGVQVVLDIDGPHLPRIAQWGAELGSPSPALTLAPSRAQGWAGRPGLTGHRDGAASQPLFELAGASVSNDSGGDVLRYSGVDDAARLQLDGELQLTIDGVLRHRQTLTSTAPPDAAPYTVDELIPLLPVPPSVVDVLDHTGRWAAEGFVQRQHLGYGTWLREQRRGRTGHDSPLLLTAGSAGFDNRHGSVWGVHLGWSGDQRYLVQRLDTGESVLGAGELLGAGEIRLGSGESYTTPWTYGVWSDRGLDGAAERLHAMLRRRPSHPGNPRSVVLNTWEAVYFDHSFDRLAALADVAADIGVERFVVDDGWFGSRRDDRSGLGDWYVSPDVWPDGLGPLADHVRARGMDFGLWFEPEMVNPDSDVARAHREWIIGAAHRMPPPQRNQQVLDLGQPDAYAHLLGRISDLVSTYDIAYIKWDHNRDTADPVHRAGPRAGHAALHEQITAAYRLMAELKERHPGLEIESCASGGARIDYGVLEQTDRVWPSDCSDPIERVRIVSSVSTLLPFELIGAHVASGRSHVTGRVSDLGLRMAVATFGHSGIEWDLTETTPDERRRLAEWIAFVKEHRSLIHSARLVRPDRSVDPETSLLGVVGPDGSEALFLFVRLAVSPRVGDAPVVFAGLDPERQYVVERVALFEAAEVEQSKDAAPGAMTTSGAQLMTAGMPGPGLRPEQAVVYHLSAIA